MPPEQRHAPVRLLAVVRHPFQLDDLGLEGAENVERVELIRRIGALKGAIDEIRPNVVLVDTGFPQGHGFEAIAEVTARASGSSVVALTSSPPSHDEVARAARAGACGFIDSDAEPSEFARAVFTVAAGGTWFPPAEVRPVLAAMADDLDTTVAERRSRLTGILLGFIPLAGLLAALMSFLWRRYLGAIGVRPVDLAVDPASRVVDAVVGLSTLLGVLGPLLFVGTWLGMLCGSSFDRGPISWLLAKRKTAYLLMSGSWLALAWVITRGPDPLLVLVIGPIVTIAVVARVAGTSDVLPRFLRLQMSSQRLLVIGVGALVSFLAVLAVEMLLIGPELGPRGETGVLVPRVLSFNAQPVRSFNLDTGEGPRELLYLGGNADLYVLVDPCNDNEIEMVSVGRHRLVVIDEVTCSSADGPPQ